MATPVQNLGLSKDGAISMDRPRALQFHTVIGNIMRQAHSLRLCADLFPYTNLEGENIDPRAAVNAFCGQIIEGLDKVYEMMENEEPKEGGAA